MEKQNRYLRKAIHCIGLDRKRPYIRYGKRFYRPYRNYYATGGPDDDWELMVVAGYAKCGDKNQRGGYTYYLTREGLDWLGENMGIHIYDEED